MELVLDSVLLFGRASLGATIGLLLGSLTQGRRHVRWALTWMLAGFAAGAAAMAPHWFAIVLAFALLVPCALGAFGGLLVGAGTLGSREDWYLRAWGFAGFVAAFHATAVGAMAAVNAVE